MDESTLRAALADPASVRRLRDDLSRSLREGPDPSGRLTNLADELESIDDPDGLAAAIIVMAGLGLDRSG